MGNDNLSHMTELLLFYAARSELVHKKIAPNHRLGNTVILDRYANSTFAYQGVHIDEHIIIELKQCSRRVLS